MALIGLEGLEDVLVALEEIDGEQIEAALTKAALIVERSAKQQRPPKKQTGELQRSIKHRVENDGSTIKGIVYTPLFYAPYVEYGTGLFAENGGRTDVPWAYEDVKGEWHYTSGQHPAPFMRPALNENRERILDIIKKGLTKK